MYFDYCLYYSMTYMYATEQLKSYINLTDACLTTQYSDLSFTIYNLVHMIWFNNWIHIWVL